MTSVKYPEMRLNLRAAANDLADDSFHAAVWANPRLPTPGNRFQFNEALAFVIDDMCGDDSSGLVATVLVDDQELAVFNELCTRIGHLLERIGPHGTFADASATPEWATVRSGARDLAEALTRTEER